MFILKSVVKEQNDTVLYDISCLEKIWTRIAIEKTNVLVGLKFNLSSSSNRSVV